MGIDEQDVEEDVIIGDSHPVSVCLQEEMLLTGKDMQEIESTIEVLTKVDLDLAYSTEKLINLHVVLMHLLAADNDLEAVSVENGFISSISMEQALVYDLLSGIFDSELREVDVFLGCLQAKIDDAYHKISSCRHLRELFNVLGEKFSYLEESLKQSQEHVLELKIQSAKLQRACSSFKTENGKLLSLAYYESLRRKREMFKIYDSVFYPSSYHLISIM